METTRQDAIKVLDNLYDGRIKYELKKLGLLDEGNIPKNDNKTIGIILLISEIEIAAFRMGIKPNYKKLNLIWINEAPYVNVFVFSTETEEKSHMISMPLFMSTFIINDIDLMVKKDKETYISVEFVKIIPGYVDAFNNKHFNEKKSYKGNRQYRTYLMLDESTGYYKIGKAIDPSYREGTLQSEKPSIKLLCTCETDIERILHLKYELKRMRGEWFNLSKKEVEEIISLFVNQN